ncbi:MAG: D-glycero-beta-D-manno-heptose-1,7-bisphosphate 7-phosphatase [Euryarchaeota archaeon]|nr:D-glycero-beta-D-manno-heptose-1,7-bisphosphate 7-phosphatase [Euryarchaeota archaeon]|tara:strand:+ start:18890 stop:19432 length:543 start_codon:yes stop_codon:yes gene_type:complete
MSDIIILDRDGVINVDLMTYVTSPEEFEPIEGSLEAIGRLTCSGYRVAIATNQACIEKEIITESELGAIHDYMKDLLKKHKAVVDHIAFCPHSPESNCKCRKPETGLLIEIENYFQESIKGKYFVGDKQSDIQAARRHGCKPLLIKAGGYGEEAYLSDDKPPEEHCFEGLGEVVDFILKN